MSDLIEIRVRSRGDNHLARTGRGKAAISASCTQDDVTAAYRCAAKAFGCVAGNIAVQCLREADGESHFRARKLVPGERITTITFVDQGQDFLQWDVTAEGIVIQSLPFQAWLWCMCTVLNMSIIESAPYVRVRTGSGETLEIKHPIERVTFTQWQPRSKGASS